VSVVSFGGAEIKSSSSLHYVDDDDYVGIKLLFVLLRLKLFSYGAMDNPDL
jgi:hypothetical protein